MGDHLLCLLGIALYICLDTVIEHQHGLCSHLVDMVKFINMAVIPHQNRDFRNIRCMVSDSFHVCYHLHRRCYSTKVSGNRLLLNQEIKADAFDFLLHLVNLTVSLHDLFCQLDVTIHQCFDGIHDGLDNLIAHPNHFFIQLLKLLVKFTSHLYSLSLTKSTRNIILGTFFLRIGKNLFGVAKFNHLSHKEKCRIIRYSDRLLHIMCYNNDGIFLF